MAYKNEPSLYPKNCISGLDWEQVHKMISDAMENRDREIHLYLNPENGLSVNVYPWPDADELYEQYKKGRITAHDFRLKMGLPPMRDPELFMKRGMLDQDLRVPTPEPKTYETVEVPNTDDWK